MGDSFFYYLLLAVGFFCIGWVASFFVMRNNPKYFNIDDMLKGKRDQLKGLSKAKLVAMQAQIADAIKNL